PRSVVLGGLLLAALALVAGAQPDEKKPKTKLYKTPQAVFNASQAALKKGDFKAHVACFTANSQKRLAVDLALDGLAMRARAAKDSKLKKKIQPVLAVLAKHGLSAKATKDIKLPRDPDDEAGLEKAHKALAALIKEPA